MVRHIQTKNADNDAKYEYLFNSCFSSMNPVHSGYGLIHCSWSHQGSHAVHYRYCCNGRQTVASSIAHNTGK